MADSARMDFGFDFNFQFYILLGSNLSACFCKIFNEELDYFEQYYITRIKCCVQTMVNSKTVLKV
jgi:hypothetical protein